MAERVLPFKLGGRVILVREDDLEALDQDVHLFGVFMVTLAEGGGHYRRIAPNDIQIVDRGKL